MAGPGAVWGGAVASVRAGDPEYEAWQAEKRSLQAKIGEITMDKELLEEKIERLEANLPLASRRARR